MDGLWFLEGRLTTLRRCTAITDKSVVPFLQKATRITSLDLSYCSITDRSLAEVPSLFPAPARRCGSRAYD
jgi:hypothetical protein